MDQFSILVIGVDVVAVVKIGLDIRREGWQKATESHDNRLLLASAIMLTLSGILTIMFP